MEFREFELDHRGKQLIDGKEKIEDDHTLSLAEYPIYELNERVSVRYKYEDYTDPETTEISAVDEGKMLHEIFLVSRRWMISIGR